MKNCVEIDLNKPMYVKYEGNKMYVSAKSKEGYKLHPFYKMFTDKPKLPKESDTE